MPIGWFDGVTLIAEAALSAATGVPAYLNANPYFENGLAAPWVGVNGATIDSSNAQAHEGSYSLRITPDGVSAVPQAQSEEIAVRPGDILVLHGWLRSASSGTRALNAFWFDAGHTFLSSSQISKSLSPGVWTEYGPLAVTVPAGAAYARIVTNDPGTPAASNSWRIDEATLAPVGGYGAWDSGAWDTVTWGPDEQWTDISAYLRWIKTDRKFGNEVLNWDAGSAEFGLSNRDGRFSADNLNGPYVVAGVSAVQPWRPFRLRATYAGVTYPVYRGYSDDFIDTWVEGHTDAYVTAPCVDEWAALSDVDGVNLSVPVGAGEPSGQRIHRVLDAAGHTGPRDIDVGRVTTQATDLSQNTVNELKVTVDSEGGGLFVEVDGTIVFEDQYALMENPRSNTVQAIFGDGTGPELPCSDVTPENTGKKIKNIASFARVGGTAQVASDPTSRALFKDKRQTRTDLVCETDAQALNLATFYVERYKAPAKRFSRIQIKPRANPTLLFPQVLGRRVRDLIRVVARPLGGPVVVRDCHIAGIHHTISGDDWITEFDLWDASVYQKYSTSRWDVGKWDSAAFFF